METSDTTHVTDTDDAASIRDQIVMELDTLSLEHLKEVLNRVQQLNGKLIGVPGWKLIEVVKGLNFEPGEVDEMQKAIDEMFGYHPEI